MPVATFYTTKQADRRLSHPISTSKGVHRASTSKGDRNDTKPTELLPPQNNSNSDKTTRQHHQNVPERHLTTTTNTSLNGIRHYDIPCLQRCIEIRTVRLVRIRIRSIDRLTSSYLSYRLLAYYSLQCSRQQSQQSLL